MQVMGIYGNCIEQKILALAIWWPYIYHVTEMDAARHLNAHLRFAGKQYHSDHKSTFPEIVVAIPASCEPLHTGLCTVIACMSHHNRSIMTGTYGMSDF